MCPDEEWAKLVVKETKGWLMKSPYLVVKRLLRTEKGSIQIEKQNKYFFEVNLDANKFDIKRAVQDIYKVKVRKVNVQVVAGKPKTLRMARGYRPDWKKAVVTLHEGQKIDIVV
jgi:large subunit ribosomal protein L23